MANKTLNVEPKQNPELNPQFDLQDVSKVLRPNAQAELLGQNNGLNNQEETSALLMNLLKDPSVTVNFLKNIFMMQEIIKLLPVNNRAFTQEIEQLFEQLLVSPDEIAQEMQNQENMSTVFKGELFDFLRGVLEQNPQQKDLQQAVVQFLKALNHYSSKEDVLGAVANSLQYLSESLSSSKTLGTKLQELAARFRQTDAPQHFDELKRDTLSLFSDVQDSILYSPKLAKVVSIAIYNLSRYNDNTDFMHEAISHVLSQLRGDEMRETFLKFVGEYLAGRQGPREKTDSEVMNVLSKILGRQAGSEELMLLNAEKVEKIIHSLLSSPCNFTPLLHFVVPVEYRNLQSFAEIWINPNGGEDERGTAAGTGKDIHMLLVFDISGIGKFEMELFVRDKTIDLSLFCPPAYTSEFAQIREPLAKTVSGLGYRFGKVNVEKLERMRSLMDVFRSLPYKRTGVDVKV